MHLLFLGYSSIVRRRVLPAARTVSAIHRTSVASRSHGRDGAGGRVDGDGAVDGWYADYEEALASAGADLVYVSGANADHAEWVMRALRQGCHVIVDKPAFLDLETAEAAVRLAREQDRGLAEATVFLFTRRQRRCARSSIRPSRVSPAPPPRSRFRRCRRATSATAPTAEAGACTTSDPTPRRRTGCCSARRRTACTAPSSRGTPRGTAASTRRSACC